MLEWFSSNQLPLWLKISYTIFVIIIIPIYWRHYGPGNFLWFSDIALFTTAIILWLESSLLASMMALSVVILESVWIVDFVIGLFAGSSVIGLSAYMFDSKIPAPIRALSLFHLFLPPLLLWLVYRLGYNSRALLWQTVLAWIVLPLSYLFTRPSENVNWVHGFGNHGPQKWLPPTLYLVLLMLAFPLILYLPSHFLLKKLFN
jgi:hypothetical protein